MSFSGIIIEFKTDFKTLFNNMLRNKGLTLEECGKIKVLKELGWSERKIAIKINRSKTAVHNFKKKKARIMAKLNDQSAREIIANLSLPASKQTVCNVLNRSEYLKYKKMLTKPPLSKNHKFQRLQFAKNVMSWNDEWLTVIFSDEKKFNLDGPDGFVFYWHDIGRQEKIFSKRQKGGGSVIIWGGFGFNGLTSLAFVSGNQKAQGYIQTLQDHLLPVVYEIGGEDWYFMQDNAPIHNAAITKKWFTNKNIQVLKWPSRSPDLNPIENLWGMLARRVYENGWKQFANITDLKSAIENEWYKIEPEYFQPLILSMRDRIFKLISKQGGSIDY